MFNKSIFSKQHLANLDADNMIGGGQVMTEIIQMQTEAGFEIYVKIPTLKPHQLEIEIENDTIWLYQIHSIFPDDQLLSGEKSTAIHTIAIPATVCREEIHAHYEGKKWVIILPFIRQHNDYRRAVNIIY
jgi:hypothetical protein